MNSNHIPTTQLNSPEDGLNIISENIKKFKHLFPEEKKPTILVCGKLGNGKTTTINTLFGEKVGKVGHFRRGTSKDEVYEWESQDEHINIIDLPGLGDTPKQNKIFREIYRQRVPEADGFIVVIAPPRPAEEATLQTVRLLLKCGVPSQHIIFAYNRLQSLRYPGPDGEDLQVEMDGLIGPIKDSDRWAIDQAKQAFFEDINEFIPRATFNRSQIIAYDSLSGWNLHKMLSAVVEILPFHTYAKLKKATDRAEKEAREREAKKLEEEKQQLQSELQKMRRAREEEAQKKKQEQQRIEKERQLLQEREEELAKEQKFKERQRVIEEEEKLLEARKRKMKEEAQQQAEELRRQEREAEMRVRERALEEEKRKILELEAKVEARIQALQDFDTGKVEYEKSMFGKFVGGISDVIEVVDPQAAHVLRKAGKMVEDTTTRLSNGVKAVANHAVDTGKKAVNWVKKGWNRLFG